MPKYLYSLLLILISLSACQVQNHLYKTTTNYIETKELKESDESITTLIAPYKQQVDKEMNTVIGQATYALTKEQPECTLGNWLADLTLKKSIDYTKLAVDFAVLNQGGIRIPTLAAGDVTRGKIFELMPFDNMLVVLELPGTEMQMLFDHMVTKEGWPISAGVHYTIKDGKAIDIHINGKEIEPSRTYKIATNDYIANGGDNCTFFKDQPRTETGKLFRDAIIEYTEELTKAGESIEAEVDGRISSHFNDFYKLFTPTKLPKTWEVDFKARPEKPIIPKLAVRTFLTDLQNISGKSVSYFDSYLNPYETNHEELEQQMYDSTWAYAGEIVGNTGKYMLMTSHVWFKSNISGTMEGEQILLHTLKPDGTPIHTLPIAQRIFFDYQSNKVTGKISPNGIITLDVWSFTPQSKDGDKSKEHYQINPDGTIQPMKK